MSVRRTFISVAATSIACCAFWFGAVQTSLAQSSSSGPSTDQLLDQLEEDKLEFDSFGWPAKGRFPNRSNGLQRYIDFNRRMWDDHRFSWMFAPTLMFQAGTQGGPNTQTSNYQHNVLFYWRPVENTSWGTGQFVFSFLQVRQLSSTTGVDLTKSLGVNWPISDSVADSNSLKSLYWQQDFPRDVGFLRFGHLELNGIVFGCAYACDDTQSFISGPLSSNPTSTMAGQGWGLVAGANLGTNVKLEIGVTDGNGDGTLQSPDSVNSNELAYAGAATFSNLFSALGDGEIKVAYYSVNPLKQGTPGAQAATRGTVINMQQDIGGFGLFARFTEASGRQALSKNSAAIGAVWKNPFGHSEDWLGVGIGSIQPTAAGAKREVMGEAYYRIQLAPLTQLTAGVIILDRPNNVGNTGAEAVFNLRLRAHF
jgi:hypothetical protein